MGPGGVSDGASFPGEAEGSGGGGPFLPRMGGELKAGVRVQGGESQYSYILFALPEPAGTSAFHLQTSRPLHHLLQNV